jgi:hypothetical protein
MLKIHQSCLCSIYSIIIQAPLCSICHLVISNSRCSISHFSQSDIRSHCHECYATDGYYYFEDWTAKADGSWFGGWPVDNYYEYEHPINIKFNLDIYFDGTYNQEIATARHELGHSVGLGHKSDAYTLMYCSRSGRKVYGLTSGDKEVLNVIY